MDAIAILEQIREQKNIVIAGHTNPDGDAIGACFAFAYALKKIGKESKILLEPVSAMYDFLVSPVDLVQEIDDTIDLFIALDCGDKQRLGSYLPLFNHAGATINIDHHTSNDQYARYNIVVENASSTCEILYELFEKWGITIDPSIALCLYTGIVYDTGSFKHTSTRPRTHEIAGALLAQGIDSSLVIHQLFHKRSYYKTKLLGKVLQDTSLHFHDQVSLSTLSFNDIKKADSQDTDGIIQFLAEIDQISIAVFLYEVFPGEVKVSLRSTGDLDVAAIAAQFNGGGHIKAAGCTILASLEEASHQILTALQVYF
ncbi:MAG: bifunctional oligoribonuclease/PAP phosphatase NrnA [Epulopiscium sp.]|nr:bifunctional oligoribonuclease/PAP phosphatase NrnA [Candidatus Epulonipiscium sp.]